MVFIGRKSKIKMIKMIKMIFGLFCFVLFCFLFYYYSSFYNTFQIVNLSVLYSLGVGID